MARTKLERIDAIKAKIEAERKEINELLKKHNSAERKKTRIASVSAAGILKNDYIAHQRTV